ncbi:MAG: hypothetical protein ABEH86_11140 [Haloarcula sp.]
MSESEDSGPGRREVAYRLFATEFDDADVSYSESDEERAPNYVVTPTGARVNRLFLVGVLTELEQVNDDVVRARVVDPTGPFVVYAGQYQPDELAFLEAADPPMFVAVTGKARTFQPDDSDRVFTSVRPESISEVGAETRDRWVVQAAEQTLSRIGRMASAKQTGLAGDNLRTELVDQGIDESAAAGITLALDHYSTTGDYLQALRDTALDAARVVAGETDEAEPLSLSPSDGTDDPIPVLATTDIDTEMSAPETTVDEPATEEPGAETTTGEGAAETATDEAGTADTEATVAAETGNSTDTATPTEEETGTASTTEGSGEPSPAQDDPTETGIESSPVTDESPSEVDSDPAAPISDDTGDSDAASDVTPSNTQTDTDSSADDGVETDLDEFEPEFELDENEREEIEQEYGTDFQSGSEVDEPGEAGIESPDSEAELDSDAEGDASADMSTDTSLEQSSVEPEPAADIDLEDAVMEVMEELDDGSGINREELLTAVVDRYAADADAVEDAIQDALMGGRCYEPEDDKLTPI